MTCRLLKAGRQILFRSIQAQHDDATGVWVILVDGIAGVGPGLLSGHRLQFPPIRIEPDIIHPLDDCCCRHLVCGAHLGRYDFQKKLQSIAPDSGKQAAQCVFLLRFKLFIVIWMVEA